MVSHFSSVYSYIRDSIDNCRYTFWAVTLIGGLGVLFAPAQTALTAGQFYFAAIPEGR